MKVLAKRLRYVKVRDIEIKEDEDGLFTLTANESRVYRMSAKQLLALAGMIVGLLDAGEPPSRIGV